MAQSVFPLYKSVTPVVKTSNGPVSGFIDNNIHTFLGIPYGKPPVGELRFMPTQRPDPWEDIRYSVRYGHAAMQISSGGSAALYPGIVGPALSQIFSAPEDILRQDEDCLVLNVWTPGLGNSGKRPVMVWFHGGGFNYGSGNWPAYNGYNLANDYDIVVVTVNHRLNVFGFLNLLEVGGEKYRYSGNAGMLDLIMSLEWVQDNISEFGGDPGNVTIMGQSGGGAKVSTLIGMPRAKGLFHKAAIQSGAMVRRGTAEVSATASKLLLDRLNIEPDNLQILHDMPADKLIRVVQSLQPPGMGFGAQWGPIVEGDLIPENPFDPVASPLCADIPLIIGCTKDETTLYNVGQPWWNKLTEEGLAGMVNKMFGPKADSLVAAFKRIHPENTPNYLFNDIMTASFGLNGLVVFAERKSVQPAPVFSYIFNWHAPVENELLKAPHTIEIPFMFNNVDLGPMLLGSDPETKELERLVSSAWVNFMKTGDPNGSDLPEWPKYDIERRATMIFDVKSGVENDPMSEVRKILQSNQ